MHIYYKYYLKRLVSDKEEALVEWVEVFGVGFKRFILVYIYVIYIYMYIYIYVYMYINYESSEAACWRSKRSTCPAGRGIRRWP